VPLRDFQTAKGWLIECNTAHKECPNQSKAELPTRLVELLPLGAPINARICSTSGHIGSCVALSYCWGGSQPFRTTTANSHHCSESLPYSNLPKTILDAFEVVRNLDLRFVWVDSLCIIQDDKLDIERELRSMVRVYQNAKLTIVAASAFRCHDGFLEGSDSYNLFRLPVRVMGNGNNRKKKKKKKEKFGTLIVSKKFGGGGNWIPASSTKDPVKSLRNLGCNAYNYRVAVIP
jgi:hypothetical protein